MVIPLLDGAEITNKGVKPTIDGKLFNLPEIFSFCCSPCKDKGASLFLTTTSLDYRNEELYQTLPPLVLLKEGGGFKRTLSVGQTGPAPSFSIPCPWDGLEPAGGIEPPTY